MDIAPLVAGVLQWRLVGFRVRCVSMVLCRFVCGERDREREKKWRPPDEARFCLYVRGVVIGGSRDEWRRGNGWE